MSNEVMIAGWSIRMADLAIVFATLLGPVLAVQAQKWLEKTRAINERRNFIFRVLMATRATRLSPNHVEALNAIPVEFYSRGAKLKQIVDDWHTYLDTLENKAGLEGQGNRSRGAERLFGHAAQNLDLPRLQLQSLGAGEGRLLPEAVTRSSKTSKK